MSEEERLALSEVVAFAKRIPAMEALVSNAEAAVDEEREEVVAELIANPQCLASEAELKAADLTLLRSMSRSFQTVDYSGMGGPRSLGITDADDGGFMALPDMSAAEA